MVLENMKRSWTKLKIAKHIMQAHAFHKKSEEALRQHRWNRLTKMVQHAYDTVPFYRVKWDKAGFHPSQLKTWADYSRIPITTKDELRSAHLSSLISSSMSSSEYKVAATTGSSGQKVMLGVSNGKALREMGLSHNSFMKKWKGIEISNPLYILDLSEEAFESNAVRMFPNKAPHFVDAMGEPAEILRRIVERKPDMIATYPTVLAILKNYLIAQNQYQGPICKLKLVICGAEAVTPGVRAMIREMFDCTEVWSTYAATETGFLGAQTEENGAFEMLHWKHVLEVLNSQNKQVEAGETGQIVVTDLYNTATPMIRYSGCGDLARTVPSKRWPGLFDLAALEGRVMDALVDTKGTLIQPFSLTSALQKVPTIGRYQIRQETRSQVRVLLELSAQARERQELNNPQCADWDAVRKVFREKLGQEMEVNVEVVPKIFSEHGANKTPLVVCKAHREVSPVLN